MEQENKTIAARNTETETGLFPGPTLDMKRLWRAARSQNRGKMPRALALLANAMKYA
jgi:hypothetical protein